MRRLGGRGALSVGALAVGLVLGACTRESAPAPAPVSSSSSSTTSSEGTTTCALSTLGVPSCGVLWGVATKPPTAAGVKAVETAVGRPFDFVYRYHDVNDTVPDDAEKALAAQGKLLHIALAARDFAAGDKNGVDWASVASGRFDATLEAQAQGIAGLKTTVFMTFEQEANQKQKASKGSGADFKAAWRHLHDIYAKAGATNVVWVWVMTGAADNLDRAAELWPGNDVVDWISWNVYNQSGCTGAGIDPSKYISFEDKMKTFYDFVHARGPALGIDADKPMMISETGSAKYANDLGKTAGWYAAIPSVLAKYPQIKAVGLWNSIDGGCDYQFSVVPTLARAVGQATGEAAVDAHLERPQAPPSG
jgi:hypothetical protein